MIRIIRAGLQTGLIRAVFPPVNDFFLQFIIYISRKLLFGGFITSRKAHKKASIWSTQNRAILEAFGIEVQG
jgi:hypothetical protein